MSPSSLEHARRFEAEASQRISPEERPLFHLSPFTGWMNDPNGFSVYKGEYHLFYQYYPYDTKWGPMHWGHAKSTDLLHWEWLPAALAPTEEYERAGCFSGSAIELPDGRHMLIYTGVSEIPLPDGTKVNLQTQNLAIGDGVNYRKYPGNPVLDASDLPLGNSEIDFRDPKIWQEDGQWYTIACNRTTDGSGAALLFSSKDALHWDYLTTLDRCNDEYGSMWECPDFFPLGDKYVILTSPQFMHAEGLEFHNGNGTLCLIGSYDPETHAFTRERASAIDYGLDFYATQTLLSPDGRRIMVAWMQSWEGSATHPDDMKWFGMMTLPRELSLRDGRLVQNPIRELEQFRANPVVHQDVTVCEKTELDGVRGRTADVTATVQMDSAKTFRMEIAANDRFKTMLTYSVSEQIMTVDRTYSGYPYDFAHVRSFIAPLKNGELKLRLIVDRFSAELFVNDGEQAFSLTLYTPQDADAFRFEADAPVVLTVEKYDLVL